MEIKKTKMFKVIRSGTDTIKNVYEKVNVNVFN